MRVRYGKGFSKDPIAKKNKHCAEILRIINPSSLPYNMRGFATEGSNILQGHFGTTKVRYG